MPKRKPDADTAENDLATRHPVEMGQAERAQQRLKDELARNAAATEKKE